MTKNKRCKQCHKWYKPNSNSQLYCNTPACAWESEIEDLRRIRKRLDKIRKLKHRLIELRMRK
jgi:hypothetical protein